MIKTPTGVCTRRDLLGAGWSRHDIDRAVEAGNLTRLRTGWYAGPEADDKVKRAVTAGGALACASALAHHGAWDLTSGTLHVRCDHNRTQPLPSGFKRCHALPARFELAPTGPVDDLPQAVAAAWGCLSTEDFVVVCDSLIQRELMTLADIRSAVGPRRGRDDVLDRIDLAESGTESMVRLRLRSRGVSVQPQQWLSTAIRVDFLVGERLVIEVDSREHHTGDERYRADRQRDLELRALGYIVVRLTYHQVVFDWPATECALLAMIRRGDQWWGSRRGTKTA